MTFNESRFPTGIRPQPRGGPGFSTTIVELSSGHEQRNLNWSQARRRYVIDQRTWTAADWETLLGWFHAHYGAGHGFRMKDWADYQVTYANGLLGAGVGTGLPTYQLGRLYSAGSLAQLRTISKPVAGTVSVKRGGVAVTFGAGAGQISVDTTTGIISFVADATSAANSITVGATTQVVLATNPGTLIAGQKLYLTGFTGADAALVNGIAHTINSVSGSGPYTFTLATNTAGKTITLGSGAGRKYPQTSEALLWSGEFDVPVRFQTDDMQVEILHRYDDGHLAIEWAGLQMIEIRP